MVKIINQRYNCVDGIKNVSALFDTLNLSYFIIIIKSTIF